MGILECIRNFSSRKWESWLIRSFWSLIRLSQLKAWRKLSECQLNSLISMIFHINFEGILMFFWEIHYFIDFIKEKLKFFRELSDLIANRRLSCKIDKVMGIVESERIDERNGLYQAALKQGDFLLNRIQKLSRVADIS